MTLILGHHHLSMITKQAQRNHYFYTDVLGMRRVKLTVNQDEPSMYHLFYADRVGTPGTSLTFFEIPAVGKTYRGTNAITRISLVVSSQESLTFWHDRLRARGMEIESVSSYAGYNALLFEDPEGLRYALVVAESEALRAHAPWDETDVPEAHQIKGIGPVEITVRDGDRIGQTLVDMFGMTKVSEGEQETVYRAVLNDIASEIIIKQQAGEVERPGRGSIHHLALRVKDEAALRQIEDKIQERFQSSGVIDRHYFKSLYVRETNGILFEVATDGPGYLVDSDEASLGQGLALAPKLEPQREAIEKALIPIDDK
ncbi:glyoxalase [Halolactibacillus miurensis]|uniref:Glyoxalase n=1 Tax=Halolactibacillus miurensis TaxID=306541 RepID=A0A1I6S5X4_9BACI|nr:MULTISPECIES: VOC family protein [Halolactibacillus]GEM04905.1 glyoxalase [Halolactibacillus miurensis]SFS72357.1 glyoxalase family protein [Halolactibacillus miurensis]